MQSMEKIEAGGGWRMAKAIPSALRRWIAAGAGCAAACALGAQPTIVKEGEYPFPVDGCGGIAYSGKGSLFYVVKDHAGPTGRHGLTAVYPLQLGIDARTGAIVSQALGEPFTPGRNRDSEDIAVDPFSGNIWLADEFGSTPDISEFDIAGKETGRSAPIPEIQKKLHRDNQSLESLTISPCGLVMWSANEQALICDGEAAFGNNDVQTVVRLMKFTRSSPGSDWVLRGSWPYRCDPCADPIFSQSGLAGLCALPDGSVLALEREISVSTCGRCRIYRVTDDAISAATELSNISALTNAVYKVVDKGKSLVDFRGSSLDAMTVYEGITLGPRLADGSLSLYLVADGGERRRKTIMGFTITAQTVGRLCALRISGVDDPRKAAGSRRSVPPPGGAKNKRRKK